MRKSLIVMLLIVGLCLVQVASALAQKTYSTLAEYERITGNKIEKFDEAPMLRIRVAAGELPPVEERLPEEPLVVEPLEQVGRYGGTLRVPARDPRGEGLDAVTTRVQVLAVYSFDLKTIVPNVAKGWELSEDYKALTIYLRKGMKWSDGAPFTADDILFWYEDIILNDELTPAKPIAWSPGGELARMEKLNDYTVRFQFARPSPTVISNLAAYRGEIFAPKHYLREYHIKYNQKANEVAKEEGYEEWWMCFRSHNERGAMCQDPNLPVVDTWVLNRTDSYGNRYYERNPYFFKVDTMGNQLPYIDKQARMLVENTQVMELKLIAGEFDVMMHGSPEYLKDYSLFKKGEEKGNYHILLAQKPRGNALVFSLNLTVKDPVLRKIFNDLRFRQAFSLAINRDEINQVLCLGKGTPRQATVVPWASFYEDWMGKYCAEYDLERANELLDEMGLKWDKNHEYRLRPDGKVLTITFQIYPKDVEWDEVVASHLGKMGIKVDIKVISMDLLGERGLANEVDVGQFSMGGSTEFAMQRSLGWTIPPWQFGMGLSCVPWANWLKSDGKSGEEPPETIKRLYKLAQEWQVSLPGTENYMELGREIQTIIVKNLFLIGTVGMVPEIYLVNNNLINVTEEGKFVSDYVWWSPYQPSQWFFRE